MKPRVLLLYYTFTNQTRRVAAEMADAFREQGWEAQECAIEFIDKRYRIAWPFRPFWPKLMRWLWPQVTGATGEIYIPEAIATDEFDLICIGSPTWWLHPAMPIVSFLKSEPAGRLLRGKPFAVFTMCRAIWWNNLRIVKKLARRQGGCFVDAAAFCFQGNQVQSALAFLNYMQTGENRDRYWGIKIYGFGISAEGIERARTFARHLAERQATRAPT